MVLDHDQNDATLFNDGCLAATLQPKTGRVSPRDHKKAHKNRAQADKLLKKVLMDQKGEKTVSDPKAAMQSILSNTNVFSFPTKRTRRQE